MKTRTFELNKLVRDGIVESHRDMGAEVDYAILTGPAKARAITGKIVEEAIELDASPTLDEIVDLQELIDQLRLEKGITNQQLQEAQLAKRERIGGFAGGWFIKQVCLPAEATLADYYAADPKRFPEIKEG
ncbi:MAG: nucleoside triphosphate pyrophosphohydrolase [bacterium]|nr:nucleoside triphosphate pyrophosphohydrolase [bacterium]